MSSWTDLAKLGVTVRPFGTLLPPKGDRSPWTFKASLSSTLELLERELRMLRATVIVMEMDVRERDIRVDGLPRADARTQTSEAIAISFDTPRGRLRWATNDYGKWESNLRSIALTLEALRAVERYGVAKAGEQYAGFRALPTSTDPADAIVTRKDAEAVIDRFGDGNVREALARTHPDRAGGSDDHFRMVVKARSILDGA